MKKTILKIFKIEKGNEALNNKYTHIHKVYLLEDFEQEDEFKGFVYCVISHILDGELILDSYYTLLCLDNNKYITNTLVYTEIQEFINKELETVNVYDDIDISIKTLTISDLTCINADTSGERKRYNGIETESLVYATSLFKCGKDFNYFDLVFTVDSVSLSEDIINNKTEYKYDLRNEALPAIFIVDCYHSCIFYIDKYYIYDISLENIDKFTSTLNRVGDNSIKTQTVPVILNKIKLIKLSTEDFNELAILYFNTAVIEKIKSIKYPTIYKISKEKDLSSYIKKYYRGSIHSIENKNILALTIAARIAAESCEDIDIQNTKEIILEIFDDMIYDFNSGNIVEKYKL